MNHLYLDAKTAKDLMTPNPVSIGETTATRAAAEILARREIGAVPVINEAGRPVGVLAQADIVRAEAKADGVNTVREIMTATVVSIPVEAPAWEVIAKMAAFKVHRLFAVDTTGVLVGVISAFDVVRKLRREKQP